MAVHSSSRSAGSASMKPWRKVLYEKQDYPDNYVDKSFLEELRKNVNTRIHSLSTLVYESGIVSQQFSSVCIYVAIFILMDLRMVSASAVLLGLILCTIIGYVLSSLLEISDAYETLLHTGQDLKSVILFTLFAFGLSPLLKTLTKTISTDTIYAMTVFMLATNLLLHDYSSEIPAASRSPSLNASIFASVCLASRLPTSWHAFVTVMLAMQMFAVMPQIRTKLKNRKKAPFILLTISMCAASICLIAVVSSGFAVAIAVSQLAISLIFPWWMVRLQKHKNNIHGPWDEALIKT